MGEAPTSMSIDQPLEPYETDDLYLVAFLMYSGLPYQTLELRPGRDGRAYTYFLFDHTEELDRLLFAYTRRAESALVIRAYADNLKTLKDTVRTNRDGVKS